MAGRAAAGGTTAYVRIDTTLRWSEELAAGQLTALAAGRHKATRSDTGKGRPERKATNIDAINQRA
jgi:hypothetical protein